MFPNLAGEYFGPRLPIEMLRDDRGSYVLVVSSAGKDHHKVFIDGLPVLQFNDNSYGAGSVAIYAFAMGDFRVDWASVESF